MTASPVFPRRSARARRARARARRSAPGSCGAPRARRKASCTPPPWASPRTRRPPRTRSPPARLHRPNRAFRNTRHLSSSVCDRDRARRASSRRARAGHARETSAEGRNGRSASEIASARVRPRVSLCARGFSERASVTEGLGRIKKRHKNLGKSRAAQSRKKLTRRSRVKPRRRRLWRVLLWPGKSAHNRNGFGKSAHNRSRRKNTETRAETVVCAPRRRTAC